MGILPSITKPESQPELDRKAESAAQKVRRAAEVQSCDPQSDGGKIDTDVEVFEAHAELERPEHYKGHPLPHSTPLAAKVKLSRDKTTARLIRERSG